MENAYGSLIISRMTIFPFIGKAMMNEMNGMDDEMFMKLMEELKINFDLCHVNSRRSTKIKLHQL